MAQGKGESEGISIWQEKSSKTIVPEHILRNVFITGLHEIKRAGIEVRVGNTGTALVVAIEDLAAMF